MTTKTTTTAPAAKLPVSYASAYAALAAVAERLKGAGTAASLDTLADDVRSARLAYKAAKARIDAIRAEIDAELAPDSEGATG